MPLRDGTGPFGEGPMTGRGMGNCKDPILGLLPIPCFLNLPPLPPPPWARSRK